MRRLTASGASSAPIFGRDQSHHDDLVALWQQPQRLGAAGAIGVPFKEITVDIEIVEQLFSNRLVAAAADEVGRNCRGADALVHNHVLRSAF